MEKEIKPVGVVLVTHRRLAEEFLRVAEEIVGETLWIRTVSMDIQADSESARQKILEAVRDMESGHGVLIITDMFGGTPTNICLSLLEEGNIEVLTGLNLPMLLKLAVARREMDLHELARCLQTHGRENIDLANKILKRRGGR